MHIYFDMDGVLVKYDRNAYLSKQSPFYQKGVHYFRDLEADSLMLNLYLVLQRQNRHHLYIVTSITNDAKLCLEHCKDKITWLQNHQIATKRNQHLLFAASPKRNCVEDFQHRHLTPQDVLIDDYNPNLEAWQEAGGTAIKYCNGLNNPDSYAGPHINHTDTIENTLQYLLALERTLYEH